MPSIDEIRAAANSEKDSTMASWTASVWEDYARRLSYAMAAAGPPPSTTDRGSSHVLQAAYRTITTPEDSDRRTHDDARHSFANARRALQAIKDNLGDAQCSLDSAEATYTRGLEANIRTGNGREVLQLMDVPGRSADPCSSGSHPCSTVSSVLRLDHILSQHSAPSNEHSADNPPNSAIISPADSPFEDPSYGSPHALDETAHDVLPHLPSTRSLESHQSAVHEQLDEHLVFDELSLSLSTLSGGRRDQSGSIDHGRELAMASPSRSPACCVLVDAAPEETRQREEADEGYDGLQVVGVTAESSSEDERMRRLREATARVWADKLRAREAAADQIRQRRAAEAEVQSSRDAVQPGRSLLDRIQLPLPVPQWATTSSSSYDEELGPPDTPMLFGETLAYNDHTSDRPSPVKSPTPLPRTPEASFGGDLASPFPSPILTEGLGRPLQVATLEQAEIYVRRPSAPHVEPTLADYLPSPAPEAVSPPCTRSMTQDPDIDILSPTVSMTALFDESSTFCASPPIVTSPSLAADRSVDGVLSPGAALVTPVYQDLQAHHATPTSPSTSTPVGRGRHHGGAVARRHRQKTTSPYQRIAREVLEIRPEPPMPSEASLKLCHSSPATVSVTALVSPPSPISLPVPVTSPSLMTCSSSAGCSPPSPTTQTFRFGLPYYSPELDAAAQQSTPPSTSKASTSQLGDEPGLVRLPPATPARGRTTRRRSLALPSRMPITPPITPEKRCRRGKWPARPRSGVPMSISSPAFGSRSPASSSASSSTRCSSSPSRRTSPIRRASSPSRRPSREKSIVGSGIIARMPRRSSLSRPRPFAKLGKEYRVRANSGSSPLAEEARFSSDGDAPYSSDEEIPASEALDEEPPASEASVEEAFDPLFDGEITDLEYAMRTEGEEEPPASSGTLKHEGSIGGRRKALDDNQGSQPAKRARPR